MKHAICDSFQEALRRKASSGSADALDRELTAHARSCRACAEELRVTGWLRSVARADSVALESRPLPSASQLWWKAQIIRRLTEREALIERAVRPVRWSQWAGVAVGCVVMALLVAGTASHLGAGFTSDQLLIANGWQLLAAFLTAGTVLPLLGFGALWLLMREG